MLRIGNRHAGCREDLVESLLLAGVGGYPGKIDGFTYESPDRAPLGCGPLREASVLILIQEDLKSTRERHVYTLACVGHSRYTCIPFAQSCEICVMFTLFERGTYVNSRNLQRFIAALGAFGAILGGLALAHPASADSIQYQSYQRASQSEACTSQPGETPWQASWGSDSSWHPSWEMWAAGGKGGWTCTREIVWARDAGSAHVASCIDDDSCTYGSIGPGGGLVFYVDITRPEGSRYFEVAPKSWRTTDAGTQWCEPLEPTDVPGASATAIGTGAANTAAMAASVDCASVAASDVLAYGGNDSSEGQWFLPSLDELNALCNYSRTWVGTPSTALCTGVQDPDFAASDFGFLAAAYWTSTQGGGSYAWFQNLDSYDDQFFIEKWNVLSIRPIRSF